MAYLENPNYLFNTFGCFQRWFQQSRGKPGDWPALLRLHASALQVSIESHWIKGLDLKTAVGISTMELKDR